MRVERGDERDPPRREIVRARAFTRAAVDLAPVGEKAGEKLAEPDRLALLEETHRREAVVPVAGADERDPPRTRPGKDAPERALDVLTERKRAFPVEKRRLVLEDREVARLLHVVRRHEGQPEEVPERCGNTSDLIEVQLEPWICDIVAAP